MARSTYGTRLEALIANPAISPRDKTFAESLLRFYTSKRRLTAGRARCVKQLEDRYSCLLYTSPSPRDKRQSRMPSSA